MEVVKTQVKENLLIVGGSGFIGSHVVKQAVSEGFNVSIISRKTVPADKKIENIEYIVVDISKYVDLLDKLNGKLFHHVINLGGYVNHSNYSESGDRVFNTHFNGVKNLVDCIDNTSLKSFIQIGSSDEYGDNPAPQSECQRESPISPYSFSKTATTHFLQMLYRTEEFPVVILRLFLVYGPGQDENRFIPQIIKGCMNNEKFPVSYGKQLRDFCYIDDIVQGILSATKVDSVKGSVINLASGDPVSIYDVVNLIQKLIKKGAPDFGKIPYRKKENMELYANVKKAKNKLSWCSKIYLEVGITRVVDSIIPK